MNHSPIRTALVLSLLSTSAFAADTLSGRGEVNWRYGNERSILMNEIWAPIWQDGSSVFYGDIRMMLDNKENYEGNLGFGYRSIMDTPLLGKGVVGAHGWLDRRVTKRGSAFHQGTLGLEFLGDKFDVLANTYIPLTGEKHYSEPSTAVGEAPVLAGTGIYVDTNNAVTEEAQSGFDIEFGLELGSLYAPIKEHTDAVRIYGGGYYFDGDYTPRVSGFRTRIAADITEDIQIGARFQRDGERGSQGFLEATFRFPFGQKKSYRDKGLYARLDDAPERDIDIVTSDAITQAGRRVAVVDSTSGSAQEVLHVDNTAAAGGDGSMDTPFNSLSGAEGAASAGTIIYVHAGDGTTTNQDQGVALDKEGMQLIGSGAAFVLDGSNYKTSAGASVMSSITLAPAGAAPKITNVNADSNGIDITADKVKVSGLTVDGATNIGISVAGTGIDWDRLEITDVSAINGDDEAVKLVIEGASTIGNIVFDNLTIKNNADEGIYLSINDATRIGNVDFDNLTINDNNDKGINVSVDDDASVDNISLDNIELLNNTDHGFYMPIWNNARIGNVSFNNVVSSNNRIGMEFFLRNDSSINSVTVKNTTISNSDLFGFYLTMDDDSQVTGMDIDNVTVTDNTDTGLYMYSQIRSVVSRVKVQNSIFAGNGTYGIRLSKHTTADIISDFGGGSFGSVGNNSIYGNTDKDVRINLWGGEFKAENNWWGVATGLDGAEVTLSNGSTVDSSPHLTSAP